MSKPAATIAAPFATGGFHNRAVVYGELHSRVDQFAASISPIDAPDHLPAGSTVNYYGRPGESLVGREGGASC